MSNYYNRSETDTAIQTAVSTSPGTSANFTVSNAELNTTLNINNTGPGYSSLYLNSVGQSSQLYTDSQGLVIGTNTAPGNILLSCNRFTNTQSELEVTTSSMTCRVNTTFSGTVTAPNLYDRTYIDAALSTTANLANTYDRTQ